MQHYFDYAAATPMSQAVRAAMEPYFSDKFYNPSALYLASQTVKQEMQAAREKVARILGCKAYEITFTAGGTEANNLAIKGIMSQYQGSKGVTIAIEHPSVLAPLASYSYAMAAVTETGRVKLDSLQKAVDKSTVLVTISYVNNEIGTMQDLREIAKVIEAIRTERRKNGNGLPLYFHTDACQAANYLKLNTDSLGIDLMTLNGGKIYGPKQSGVLYVRNGVQLRSLIEGGGQERGLRSGTENLTAIVGFAAALSEANDMQVDEQARLSELRDYFIAQLTEAIPSILVNGDRKHRIANNIHVTIPGIDNERLLMELDERGFMLAAGSACSASNDEPSHVLKAIGLSDEDARSSLRITLGRRTDKEALDQLLNHLLILVR